MPGVALPSSSRVSSESKLDSLEPFAKHLRPNERQQAEPVHKPPASEANCTSCPEPGKIHGQHGPEYMKLSAEQKQQLVRMHNNLGHRDATLLGNVLRDQKWPSESIEVC